MLSEHQIVVYIKMFTKSKSIKPRASNIRYMLGQPDHLTTITKFVIIPSINHGRFTILLDGIAWAVYNRSTCHTNSACGYILSISGKVNLFNEIPLQGCVS